MHGKLQLDTGPGTRARALLRAVRLTTIALVFGVSCTDSATRSTSPEVLNGVAAIASGDISSKGAFTQCQNDNPGPTCNWVTGTLNAVHSAYREGEIIPFKLLIKNATTSGADAVHSITLTYGFQKATSQVNANYDFQARWDQTLGANANPCLDTSNLMNPFCTNGALKAGLATAEVSFPAPTAANTPGLSATDRAKLIAAFDRFTNGQGKTASLVVYGGNFTGIAQPISNVSFFGSTDPSGNTLEARVTFTFRATSSDVMLLWGQHFAAGLDWQNNGAPVINGAAGQSGSPFHVVLETLDGASTGGKALNVSGDVIQLDPGAKIDLSPLNATNGIGESHTVTVTVSERTDASLPFAPAVGETVTFTLTNSNGANAVLDAATSTCDNLPTDANGQCTIVFSSATAGTVTVHAQSSVGVGGQTTLASSGTGGSNSGDALKTFVAGTLEWNKVDGNAAFLGGAEFTVCRTETWDSDLNAGAGGYTNTADVCVDVTDNVSGTDNTSASPTDREGDAGKFRLGGLILGKYTIVEKTPPSGYTLDPDTENASLSISTPSATVATAFVDPKPDARITIAGAATNGIGESHTFTVTLEKNLGAGAGWVVAAGEHVSFNLANAGGAAAVLDAATSTCDNVGANTNASGQCIIVFASASAGTVTGSASASLTVGGVALNVQTGPNATAGSSANVVKTFVAGSLRWLKHDGAGQLLGGAVFTVCRTETWDSDLNAGAGGYTNTADVCGDVTDNAAPDADPTDGEFQLNGLTLGKYTIVELTPPSGYTKDPDTENASLSTTTTSVTIATAFVNPRPGAKISIAGAATNGIGESHTFTVTLQKDLGAGGGFVAAAGEHVDATLTNGGGASYAVDAAASSCDNAGANTDANGQCIVVFTSNSAGTVTGSASASLTVGGVALSVNTGAPGVATPGSSANVVKTFVAGSLRWLKKDGLGALLGGAVFTVCRTERWDSDLPNGGGYVDIDPDVCIDVTDNSAPDTDADAGEFQLGGLILGKYTVAEKTPPAGYIKDNDTENASLSTSAPSATITTAFVNISPDAFITIGPGTATNDVGQAHTFTAVMTVDPKGGPAPVIAAISISVSPTPSTLGSVSCPAQTGPDANGKYSRTCTLQINSTSTGTFTANASGSATVAGATLTRDTDPATANIGAGPGGSGPAQKTYVAPILSIDKTPDDVFPAGSKVVGDSAIFTITVSNSAQATGSAKDVQILDTLPNPAPGLTWVERTDKAECAITIIDVDPGAPVVNGQLLACNTIGTLAPGASFTVQVAAKIPAGFLLKEPADAGDAIEIDGDLAESGLPGADWASLPSSVFTCTNPRKGCDIDVETGSNDNSFGQGAKEDSPVPSVVTGSIPNNKSDLLRFYVAHQRFGLTDFLYLAWSRVQAPTGTTNMDFELNQSSTLSGNGVTPVRTANDILIKYDLAKGGTHPTISFNRWLTAASAAQLGLGSAGQACEASNSFPCWGKTVVPAQDVTVKAAINEGIVQELGAGSNLDPLTFGEASINLQGSGIFQQGVCTSFGSAYLKSRSSDAFSSELKDFIAPIGITVPSCDPKAIPNRARARASNFAPAGGAMNDWTAPASGNIVVVESLASNTTLSNSSQHFAMYRERGELWVRRGGDDE